MKITHSEASYKSEHRTGIELYFFRALNEMCQYAQYDNSSNKNNCITGVWKLKKNDR